jgi:hypothetical protein
MTLEQERAMRIVLRIRDDAFRARAVMLVAANNFVELDELRMEIAAYGGDVDWAHVRNATLILRGGLV